MNGSTLFSCTMQQVPQSAIGSIIGSGGSNINRIRQETGARIKVFDEPVRHIRRPTRSVLPPADPRHLSCGPAVALCCSRAILSIIIRAVRLHGPLARLPRSSLLPPFL